MSPGRGSGGRGVGALERTGRVSIFTFKHNKPLTGPEKVDWDLGLSGVVG